MDALICPECGEEAVGSLQTTDGEDEGLAEFDGLDEDGELNYTGNSSLYFTDGCYDSDDVTDEQGRLLLECPNGHQFPWIKAEA